MIDLYLEAAYGEEQEKTAQRRQVELLKQLPEETLMKIASGEDKLAYFDSDCKWLDRFKGTPLFDKALAIEQEELQQEMSQKEERAESSERFRQEDAQRDDLRVKRKMLDLELAKVESGSPEETQEAEKTASVEKVAILGFISKTKANKRFDAAHDAGERSVKKEFQRAQDQYAAYPKPGNKTYFQTYRSKAQAAGYPVKEWAKTAATLQEVEGKTTSKMTAKEYKEKWPEYDETSKKFRRGHLAVSTVGGGAIGNRLGGFRGKRAVGTLAGAAIGGGTSYLGSAAGKSLGDKMREEVHKQKLEKEKSSSANPKQNMAKFAESVGYRAEQIQEIEALMGQYDISAEEAHKRYRQSNVRVAGGLLGALAGVYGAGLGGVLGETKGPKGVLLGAAIGGAALGSAGFFGGRALGASESDKTIGYHKMQMKKAAGAMGLLEKDAAGVLGALKGVLQSGKAGWAGKGAARKAGKEGFGGATKNVGTYMGGLAKKKPGLAAGMVAAPALATGYAAG